MTPETNIDDLQVFNKEDTAQYIVELEKLCVMYAEQIKLLREENELLRRQIK